MPAFRKALCKIIIGTSLCAGISCNAFGQNARVVEHQASASDSDRDHVQEREEWFRSGRRALGENAADLLHRAYKEKVRMRAAREQVEKEAAAAKRENSRAIPEISATPNFSNLVWQSLGPTPVIF